MNNIGILAYGSLIDCPGQEIQAITANRVEGVKTPFKVEFARSSLKRDGAPTLVPVEEGGACVEAVILVLEEHISEQEAKDMLWRRETCRVGSKQTYDSSAVPGPNTVCIERLENFRGIRVVLYTSIAATIPIPNRTPQMLAELAIKSARAKAGAEGRDGISYLIAAKRNEIVTPLMPGYEKEILRQTGPQGLEEALCWERLRACLGSAPVIHRRPSEGEQEPDMIVTAWNNGAHHESGAGYGLKISAGDRDRYFRREWGSVILELEGVLDPISVNIDKPSFWDPACGELISKEIGQWLRSNAKAPWPKWRPPKFSMEPISDNRFFVHLSNS